MSETITLSTTLEVLTCSECGIPHAMPRHYVQTKREDHTGWKCPNGHGQYFPQESDAEKLQRQLDREKDRRARIAAERDQLAASLRSQKGATTRAKKRAAAALCPCCNRSFVQLRRHMQAKHPGYDPAAA